MRTVDYHIQPSRPAAHRFTVGCTVATPEPEGQCFTMPAWVPGSYLIRDFARHVLEVRAAADGRPVAVEQIDKQSWRCAPCDGPLTLTCEIHAHDASVRSAFLDRRGGFFNGTSVFLRAQGHAHLPCRVTVDPPAAGVDGDWRVATTLPVEAVDDAGFGSYRAADYAALIDHPVALGPIDYVEFEVAGRPHALALLGRHDADRERLAADLAAICKAHADFWGELPVDRYVFLAQVVAQGYGGLEHGDSAMLQVARDALPVAHRDSDEAYSSFLGLCSHEYFHLWNVKRIRPAAVAASDLTEEAYFHDLWAYEGVTAYYDELALVRAGLLSPEAYLDKLATAATRLQRTPARRRQSLAQASLTAWTKFYRPDDNRPNAVVSYYNKGALLALCLDLMLRRESGGEASLDSVLRRAWQRYGRPGEPVPDGGLERLVIEAGGGWTDFDWSDLLDRSVHGTEDPPFVEALGAVGVRCERSVAEDGSAALWALGVQLVSGSGEARLAHVLDDSPAQAAGLSAGDSIVAVDCLRTTAETLAARLSRRPAGTVARLHLFRGDELLALDARLGGEPEDTWHFSIDPDAPAAAVARRRDWLGS